MRFYVAFCATPVLPELLGYALYFKISSRNYAIVLYALALQTSTGFLFAAVIVWSVTHFLLLYMRAICLQSFLSF